MNGEPVIEPTLDPVDADRWEPPSMKSIQSIEGNPLVECGCGRMVNADMMREIEGSFVCDACHETKLRTGELTREDFALSMGAPPAVIARARQLDLAQSQKLIETQL